MTQCGIHGSMEYVKQLEAERDTLRARVEVLEKAVEWACDGFRASRFRSDDGFGSFRNELRRKAKEG